MCAAGRLVCFTCYEELLEKDTLLIPKASPSTSINITINCCESKKKICDDKSPTGLVLKMGPCGGGFGDVWEMDVRGVDRIVKLVLWHCGAVDAISVVYEWHGREDVARQWGKPEGEHSEICLEPDEYLTGVKGWLGNYGGCFLVGSVTFVSNRRTFGPYGMGEGAPFELPAAGGRIIGFHGRSGGLLNALGTYVKMG